MSAAATAGFSAGGTDPVDDSLPRPEAAGVTAGSTAGCTAGAGPGPTGGLFSVPAATGGESVFSAPWSAPLFSKFPLGTDAGGRSWPSFPLALAICSEREPLPSPLWGLVTIAMKTTAASPAATARMTAQGVWVLFFFVFVTGRLGRCELLGTVSNWVRNSSPPDPITGGGTTAGVSAASCTAAACAASRSRNSSSYFAFFVGFSRQTRGRHLVEQLLGQRGVLPRVEPLQVRHPLVGGVFDHLGVGLEEFDGQEAVMMNRSIPGRNAKPLEVWVKGFAHDLVLPGGQHLLL